MQRVELQLSSGQMAVVEIKDDRVTISARGAVPSTECRVPSAETEDTGGHPNKSS